MKTKAQEKKEALKKFRAHMKAQEAFSKVLFQQETFADHMMDDLAKYMDLHFGGSTFSDLLCK